MLALAGFSQGDNANVTIARRQTDIWNPGYFSTGGVDYNDNIIRPRSFGIRWSQRFE